MVAYNKMIIYVQKIMDYKNRWANFTIWFTQNMKEQVNQHNFYFLRLRCKNKMICY